MTKVIHVSLNSQSIDAAIHELREYQKWIERKATELAERLAEYGLERVRIGYDAAIYDGRKEVNVEIEPRGHNTYAIVASGKAVLFLEFGAGVKYGAGHPKAMDFGYGPGTYPGQTHVPDPGYWWFTEDGKSHFSVGNAPSMVMYMTGMELRYELERIAKEVFNSD